LSSPVRRSRIMPHPQRLQTLFRAGTTSRSNAVQNRI
jgi:hypothetical protein